MDETCRAAYRAALEEPHDRERRAAYARQLLRVGHRVAAARELEAAGEPPIIDDTTPGWTIVWREQRIGGPAVAPPDRPDARFPGAWAAAPLGGRPRKGARVEPLGTTQVELLPLPLVPWPGCDRCRDGAPCDACGSSSLLPVERPPPPGCEHTFLVCPRNHEWTIDDLTRPRHWRWKLERCTRCGGAALTSAFETRWACAACGRFACVCPETPPAGANAAPAGSGEG